ncbi:hypothetical protein BdWA1_000956 [Babesia duncani]|uniref:Uncharacterized protein n=1 Tax=Babesia duncani TaxID=323732 RepID=A0AAD9UQK0_9APIC|nr:hypothetical protein BdWA1_000956 [Babesia duncani]
MGGIWVRGFRNVYLEISALVPFIVITMALALSHGSRVVTRAEIGRNGSHGRFQGPGCNGHSLAAEQGGTKASTNFPFYTLAMSDLYSSWTAKATGAASGASLGALAAYKGNLHSRGGNVYRGRMASKAFIRGKVTLVLVSDGREPCGEYDNLGCCLLQRKLEAGALDKMCSSTRDSSIESQSPNAHVPTLDPHVQIIDKSPKTIQYRLKYKLNDADVRLYFMH